MGTDYPGALDTFINPAPTDGMNLPAHSAQHANANDAIAAIQAELGTNPSGGYDTVAARLAALGVGGGGGGGGLTLVDSDSFAGVSSLSLPDGSFDSSAHDDYRLIVDWVNAGGSGGYENYLRMRASGADNTAASYATSGIYHGGATGHKTNTAQTAFTGLFDGSGSGDFTRLVLDVLRPAEPSYTTISGHRIYTYGGTLFGATLSGLHAVASAFDALTIVSASGTLTGSWRLYGYPK